MDLMHLVKKVSVVDEFWQYKETLSCWNEAVSSALSSEFACVHTAAVLVEAANMKT